MVIKAKIRVLYTLCTQGLTGQELELRTNLAVLRAHRCARVRIASNFAQKMAGTQITTPDTRNPIR